MQRIFFILTSGLLLASCIKDKGNYEYTTLPAVTIAGVGNSYRVLLQDSLKIAPQVSTTTSEENLQYNWMVGADTLCKTKAFNYTFTKESVAEQQLVFEIRNKLNNVRYIKKIQLTVVSPFQTGWAILSEKENHGYLSFYSYESGNLLYKDVYKLVNSEPLGSEPMSVKHLYAYDVNRISVLCKGGKSVELNGSSLLRVKYYQDEFRAPVFAPVAMNIEQFDAERYFFIFSSGKIYIKIIGSGSSVDDSWYESPLMGDAKGFRVGYNYAKATTLDYYVTFDELNKRYVRFSRNTFIDPVTSLSLVTGNLPAFDPDNVDGTCLWMGRSSAGKILSVIKTSDGSYVLHVLTNQVVSGRDRYLALNSYTFPAGVVTDQSCFTPHGTSPYLFVGTGSKLYAVNLDALSQGAAAINYLTAYDGNITALSYTYKATKSINELGVALQTNDANFPGTLLLVDPNLSASGAILKRVEKVGGVIKSICRKTE